MWHSGWPLDSYEDVVVESPSRHTTTVVLEANSCGGQASGQTEVIFDLCVTTSKPSTSCVLGGQTEAKFDLCLITRLSSELVFRTCDASITMCFNCKVVCCELNNVVCGRWFLSVVMLPWFPLQPSATLVRIAHGALCTAIHFRTHELWLSKQNIHSFRVV